jgi:uncharacterized membrane protein
MDKRMTMIGALESHYKSLMDRRALDINNLLEESDSESLDLLLDNIQQYSVILSQFNFVQKLKEKTMESMKKDES